MRSISYKYLSISILTLLLAISTSAQNVYKLNAKSSKLTITGTSSLHDWEMEATGFSAEAGLKIEDNVVFEIQYVKFTSPVADLESSKNIMDNKAREALKEKDFPQIKFSLVRDGDIALPGNSAELAGILSLSGKTKEIKVPVNFNIESNRQFKVEGKVQLKMTDFGIEPPTAILGTLKTDNEVEVEFNFEFSRSN